MVTLVGLVGTIATGFLGMNLIDEAAAPFHLKLLYFMGVLIPSVALVILTVVTSGRLAKLIDAFATEGFSIREKLARLKRAMRVPSAVRSRKSFQPLESEQR